ncbi:hypothetical protein ACFY20_39245 [Streptomyces sp. NPDC001312]|uniref:hypothetical protein n=1 Tax=Streptomyces sp. NPDC001312 TaxID=3364561 RepID=UPI0036B4E1C0
MGASLAITTATSTAKSEQSRTAGYEVTDLSRESLRDGVARLTDGKGVDVVLDGVARPITGQALGALAQGAPSSASATPPACRPTSTSRT